MASQKARLQNTAAGRAILHRTGTATELRAFDGQRSLPPEVRSKITANPIPRHMSHELHEGRRKARVNRKRRQFKSDPYVQYVDLAAYPAGGLFAVAAVNGRDNSLTLAASVRAETPATAETIAAALVIKQHDRATEAAALGLDRGERGPWAEATTGNAVASASSPPSPPPGATSPSGSSSRASSSSTAVVVVVASPGPGRRPGPAWRPPGGAVAVIGEGDLDANAGRAVDDDVEDEGVFVEEVLVVAGDLESPLRRSLLLNDFDPEGFGEIPWSDFLRALETPEFCQAVGPAKREILTAKAHRSRTSAITFDDFVAVIASALDFGRWCGTPAYPSQLTRFGRRKYAAPRDVTRRRVSPVPEPDVATCNMRSPRPLALTAAEHRRSSRSSSLSGLVRYVLSLATSSLLSSQATSDAVYR
ncbi:hypothetical protein HPB49_023226 [Dermacentor silvarum]|uniref:Uncharacterized protein n=1 Tax=Dermacentor silvarum TaxID=543639 RepID=A0ACB8CTQ0_DERSI|nr:hypothetical protein HPB49_023226 [Dermacentor silvarum]